MYTGFPTPQIDYYKVYVRSCTYNQSQYIVDCLNGVAIQKTDFPFVHHVIDDCSTDGEQEVIKTYLNNNCDMENAESYDNDICSIIIAKNKSNPNCTLAVYFLKKNMFRNPEKRNLYKSWENACNYIALCEGDDYWIDSLKLHKQVLFFKSNPDCSLCYHACKNVFEYEDNNETTIGESVEVEYDFKDILRQYSFQTATVMYRNRADIMALFDKVKTTGVPNGDVLLFLCCSQFGRLLGINEQMSVYRRNKGGISLQIHIARFAQSTLHWMEASKFFDSKISYEIHSVLVFKRMLYSSIGDFVQILFCEWKYYPFIAVKGLCIYPYYIIKRFIRKLSK